MEVTKRPRSLHRSLNILKSFRLRKEAEAAIKARKRSRKPKGKKPRWEEGLSFPPSVEETEVVRGETVKEGDGQVKQGEEVFEQTLKGCTTEMPQQKNEELQGVVCENDLQWEKIDQKLSDQLIEFEMLPEGGIEVRKVELTGEANADSVVHRKKTKEERKAAREARRRKKEERRERRRMKKEKQMEQQQKPMLLDITRKKVEEVENIRITPKKDNPKATRKEWITNRMAMNTPGIPKPCPVCGRRLKQHHARHLKRAHPEAGQVLGAKRVGAALKNLKFLWGKGIYRYPEAFVRGNLKNIWGEHRREIGHLLAQMGIQVVAEGLNFEEACSRDLLGVGEVQEEEEEGEETEEDTPAVA